MLVTAVPRSRSVPANASTKTSGSDVLSSNMYECTECKLPCVYRALFFPCEHSLCGECILKFLFGNDRCNHFLCCNNPFCPSCEEEATSTILETWSLPRQLVTTAPCVSTTEDSSARNDTSPGGDEAEAAIVPQQGANEAEAAIVPQQGANEAEAAIAPQQSNVIIKADDPTSAN